MLLKSPQGDDMGILDSLFGYSPSPSNLAQLIQQGALVLDVRSQEEFVRGHYPQASHIPLDQLPLKLNNLCPTHRTILVYCASGGRSAVAARMLKAAGYANVINAGGLADLPAPSSP